MSQARERTLGDLGYRRVSRVELFPPTVPSLVPTAGALIFGKTTGAITSWATLAGAAKGTMFYNSALNTPAWLAAGALGSMMYNSAASTPAWLTIGAASTLLRSNGTSPSWGTVSLLSAYHGDTTAAAVVRGDMITGQGVGATWSRLAIGTAGKILRSDGTDLAYSTSTFANTYTQGDLLHASAANTVTGLADVATGQLLKSGGVGLVPAWGTITLLNGSQISDTASAAAARGAIIVGNATPAWARVTVGAAGTLIYTDGTDTVFSTNLTWSEATRQLKTVRNDATPGGGDYLARNDSTGDVGIKFDVSNYRANLWQIFFSNANGRIAFGRDSLADYWYFDSANIRSASDNSRALGTTALRFSDVISAKYSVYAAASDANASATLAGGATGLQLGAGGATALDVQLSRGAADRMDLASGDSLYLVSGSMGISFAPLSTVGLIVSNSGSGIISIVSDAGTTNIPAAIVARHDTSGTAAANFGVDFQFQYENAAGTNLQAHILRSFWTVATAGSEVSAFQLFGTANGGVSIGFEQRGTGTANAYNYAFIQANASPNYQGMVGGLFVGNVTTTPAGNPSAGGFMYSNAGAGTWRGSSGTVTAFGPAKPYCDMCGLDDWEIARWNEDQGWYHFKCGNCGEDYRSQKLPINRRAEISLPKESEVVKHGMTLNDIISLMNAPSV